MSMISIFQILTLEGWTNMMYNFMDVNESNILVVIYFCLVVLFGSFFAMNLILAAIMDSFD
jgi:voltage-dependent calcium channel L type alpha-1D